MFTNLDYSLIGQLNNHLDGAAARLAAAKKFDQAYSRGRWGQFWARVFGRPAHLDVLESQPAANPRRTTRIVTVPIDRIKGSVSRSADFDASFNPLVDHTRERWISVAAARQMNLPLPPVELVQVGDAYYVQDGHHRISVARAMKQDVIEARIVN